MNILNFLTIALTLKVCEFLVLKFIKAPSLIVIYPIKKEKKLNANVTFQINSITDRKLESKTLRVARLRANSVKSTQPNPPLNKIYKNKIASIQKHYNWFYFQSNYNLPEVFWLKYYINHFNAIPKFNSNIEKPIFKYYTN
jgi:hypothetical protein